MGLSQAGTIATVAVCAALAAGCGPAGKRSHGPAGLSSDELATAVDAPYELAETGDLELVRKRFEAMPIAHADRALIRAGLAAEYARRIESTLERGIDPEAAFEELLSLLSLWSPQELGARQSDFARHKKTFRRVRDYFARGGGDHEATTALAALLIADPAQGQQYRDEIDEIFVYADNLSVAQYGPGAQRARPIELLETAAQSLLSPYVVRRLSALYLERQRAVESQIRRKDTADISLIRAHGSSVLDTARKIVSLHARAGRLGDAPGAISGIVGIGDNATLRRKLVGALKEGGDPAAWIALAQAYRDRDSEKDDPATALAIARAGAARMPDAAGLHCLVGQSANASDSPHRAIAGYERCLELAPKTFAAAEVLAELYEARMGELVYSDRPQAALAQLKLIESFHASAAKRWPDKAFAHDLPAAYAAFGRGLVSLGELDEARVYLRRSVAARPDFPALESLGTVALKLGQFAEASRYLDLALRLPAGKLQAQFRRAKILRLAAEAHAGASDVAKAERYSEAALLAWRDVGGHGRLLDRFQGELHLERGQLLWNSGSQAEALVEFDKAVDADPDGSTTLAGVVAFLVVRDQRRRALDAYHRALGSFKITEYFKVYMSLWVLAEARQHGASPDSIAMNYLNQRSGRLWHDQLAAFATGRATLEALERRATTRARRAELLYYAAVLSKGSDAHGPGRDSKRTRKLLQDVVASQMITFFEYDMAKRWLKRGLRAQRTAPAKP